MAELLSIADLPEDFEYPPELVRVVELGLTQLEPWWVLEGDLLRTRYRGLRERYPSRTLVPFAIREDRDDVACFELNRPGVVIIHDFASPGWEQREQLPDFYSWLRRAIDDLIEFDV
jgi:hypothetical protein